MISDLRNHIEMLMEQLGAEGYGGHQQRVRTLIGRCRAALGRATGHIGPWETLQLDAAERAVEANFLRLALIEAQDALALSQLPHEEYEFGLPESVRKTPGARCGGLG